jgi:tetratricopeptide (TPR) repeat protein
MDGYSAQEVVRMLGVSPGRLRSYVRAGFLSPERGERGRLRFSFRDLLLLRTAEGLVAERIPPRRVLQALKSLRQRLPETQPLTELQLAADGDRVVVRDGGSRWQPESGQILLAFDDEAPARAHADTRVSAFPPPRAAAPVSAGAAAAVNQKGNGEGEGQTSRAAASPAEAARATAPTVDDLHQLGCALEETDLAAAQQAYRRLLAIDANHADGHINLGRLLHESGQVLEAEQHYRRALEIRPGDAMATFNLAVAIEDQGRIEEALAHYERAMALDGRNPDAHYNAARLYEKAGKYAAAVRHLRAYRELTR